MQPSLAGRGAVGGGELGSVDSAEAVLFVFATRLVDVVVVALPVFGLKLSDPCTDLAAGEKPTGSLVSGLL